MLPLLAPLWLATAAPGSSALAPGEVDAVELPWSRYAELTAEAAPTEPGPWVAERDVTLHPVEGGFELEARWAVRAEAGGWLWQPLVGPGIELRRATLDGARAPVIVLPEGARLAAWVDGSPGRTISLEVRAFVPHSREGRIDLALMPATRGQLRAPLSGRVLVPVADEGGPEAPPLLDGGIVWSGASQLSLELREPDQAPPTRQTLAVAHAGVGLTIGDAELRGRAHLQWELRRGSIDEVRATVADLGDDLVVEGRDVASWSRDGNTLVVQLTAPVDDRLDLDLRWSRALPSGDEAQLPVPRIEPQAFRTESSLQLARDGEIEVVPEADGWTAVAGSALPAWGQGLVEGTPTAAYQRAGGSGSGHLDLLRFVPVPGPPTVVDVAAYTMATTAEGRVLMKAYYELRNDRGAHLTVRPPEGLRIIGARVAGETALPSRDEDGAWRIPLKRSLETVEGLLSFPVEVLLMGEVEPWARREQRTLALPTLDAPIAAARVTLHLPYRYRSRLEEGEHNVVDRFGDGDSLAYGRGVGDVGSAEADALFQEAVEGYLANDFGEAQAKLEELEQLGVSNENMARLQSNLDVFEGKSEAKGKGDRTLERRVKEQAKARAVQQVQQQELIIAEAERAASAGDYARAESQYQAAIDIGDELAKLEQRESVEQTFRNEGLQVQLSSVSGKKAKRAKKKRKRGKLKLGNKSAFGSSFGASGGTRQGKDEATALGGADGVALEDEPMPATPKPEPAAPEEPATITPDAVDAIALGNEEADVLGGVVGGELDLEDEEEPEPEPEPEDLAPPPPAPDDEPISARRGRRGIMRRRATGNRRRDQRSTKNRLETKFKKAAEDAEKGRRRRVQMMSADSFAPPRRPRPPREPSGTTPPAVSDNGNADTWAMPSGEEVSPTSTTAAADRPAEDPAPIERLAAPEVNASALSVVIPATGRAVRYEQLLIDANQTQTVTIDARRRLRR